MNGNMIIREQIIKQVFHRSTAAMVAFKVYPFSEGWGLRIGLGVQYVLGRGGVAPRLGVFHESCPAHRYSILPSSIKHLTA